MFSRALPPVTVRVSRAEAPATRVAASYMVVLAMVVLAAALLFSYSVAQAQSLSAPTTLNAVTYSKNQINLAWNDRNSISSGMQEWGYIVQRAEWTPSGWGKVLTSGANVTSWSSTGLSTGTLYYYRVKAFAVVGGQTIYSAYSPIASAWTQSSLYPNPATGLTATALSATQITLNWQDQASNETGYKVQRAPSSLGPWSRVGTTATNQVTYMDSGLTPGTPYFYRVKAYNATGTSAPSNVATATPKLSNGTLTATEGSARVALSWAGFANGSGLTAPAPYKLVFSTSGFPAASCMAGALLYSGTGTSLTHTGLINGTTYYYRVCASDSAGHVSTGATASATPEVATSSGQLRWAQRFGGASTADSAFATGVAVDSGGNAVVVGYFQYTVNFGGGPLTSAGGNDIFLAKYSATGAYQWARRLGAAASDSGYAVAVDASGDILVVGGFSGTVNFGGGPLTSAGSSDIFVAKLSGQDGTYMWARRYGGTGADAAYAVKAAGNGDVFVAGRFGFFGSPVDFGGGPLASAGSYDTFVAKFSGQDGSFRWARRFGGTGIDSAWGLGVDGSDNVVVAGTFQNSVDFGGGALTSAGGYDIFVAKYSGQDGSFRWARRLGGASDDSASGVAVNGAGQIAVVGSFWGTVDFGGGPLTSHGGSDIFVATYSATGDHVWSRNFGSSLGFGHQAYAVAIDGSGNVAVTGAILSALDFGGGALLNADGAGTQDIFVVKFAATGAHVWSKRAGGAFDDAGRGVALDATGSVLATGDFAESANFGSGGSLSSPGGTDSFLVKYGP